jgi:hypothetical protein
MAPGAVPGNLVSFSARATSLPTLACLMRVKVLSVVSLALLLPLPARERADALPARERGC